MPTDTLTHRLRGWRDTARAAFKELAAPATKAHRASPYTAPYVSVETLRTPQWAPRDYAAFAREGFMQNAVVYRCVRMIAENAAAVPLLVYDGAVDLDDHPLLTLVDTPNANQTRADFLEHLIGFLLVAGNAYVEAVATSDDAVRALYVLRPDRMAIVPGADGWPDGYVYSLVTGSAKLTRVAT